MTVCFTVERVLLLYFTKKKFKILWDIPTGIIKGDPV
jgi:hypothetical protein